MKCLGSDERQGEKLRSKFLGCLLGVALGDALGACREGRPMAQEGGIEYLAQKLGWLTYTDDTHFLPFPFYTGYSLRARLGK